MPHSKTPIFQVAQIRECERIAKERFALSGQVLMQRAGKAAFDFLQRRWAQAKKIAVFCGAGNNGGDGYVLAKLAHERGLKVTVWLVGDQQNLKEEAKQAFAECKKANVAIEIFTGKEDLQHPDVIVDAICGIGLQENLRADMVAIIEKIAALKIPIFAIDIPTGINADTGKVLGSALHATATMTFVALKFGLMTGDAVSYIGELVCNDLQLPAELFSCIDAVGEKIQLNNYAHSLPPRTRDWHKGRSGHVLIVGGDHGYVGAVRLAAEAALRTGAGLVSVATRPELAAFVSASRPEIMAHGISSAAQLDELLAKATVVVLGPGLGQSDWAKKLWQQVCLKDLPKVIDADGLNLLAQTTLYHEGWVLTPHPGEAARLLGETTLAIQEDRLKAIKALKKRYGGVVVLKGAGSLVLASNALLGLCDKGNPGMATAGMGDVLSGIIGSLIAQGMPLGEAAKLGVAMHAAAGDLAAKEGERGLIASDLMPHLRRLVNPT